MRRECPAVAGGWIAVGVFALALGAAQQLPFEPAHDSGQSITGAFEGWFANADGSFRILVGYYNRNQKQEIDIPAGPNNRIEPGGPDQGQPTHFLTTHQWGVFTVKVPADFGNKKLTWTIVANGLTNPITMHTPPQSPGDPFPHAAARNNPSSRN